MKCKVSANHGHWINLCNEKEPKGLHSNRNALSGIATECICVYNPAYVFASFRIQMYYLLQGKFLQKEIKVPKYKKNGPKYCIISQFNSL